MSGGALGGGRMVEDSSSVAGADRGVAYIFCLFTAALLFFFI